MANQDRTKLQATIAANLKDNTTGYITPARLREVQNNISDSIIYSAAAGIQQMPLLQTSDGFVKTEITSAEPAWIQGSLSITENNLTEPTLPAYDFLYVQAGGYIWGLQLNEPTEIPSGYTGEIVPNVTFKRIVDIETYEELAGHITLDETIYGNYAVIQNANPIAVEFGLTINNFNGGSDAGTDISPLLTLDGEGLLNFNTKRVAGIAEGLNPNDAVNWNQLSQTIGTIYRICTKVLSQYASSGTDITVKLNRALTNNEGFETDVWYCYDTTSGVEVVPTITEGAADSYTLQFTSSANIKVVFRGENLPFVLPE